MERTISFLLSLICSLAVFAGQYTVDKIPNVHLKDSTRYVTNPDGVISAATVAELDAMLNRVRRSTSAEAVLVVVDDIDSDDIDTFANDLFSKWGLGKNDLDNGLLVLVAKDMRKAVIRPGYGLEGVLPDIVCARILREQMFPSFRKGDYDTGIMKSMESISGILLDPQNREEILSAQADVDLGGGEGSEGDSFHYYIVFCIVLAIGMLFFLLLRLYSVRSKSDRDKYLALSGMKPIYLGMTVAGLFIPIVASLPLVILLYNWRNGTHKCPRCGTKMKKIDEVHDNEYLAHSQDIEEKIGSVDYDVWLCPKCGEKDIEQYVAKGTPYCQCDKCHAYTSRLIRSRILRDATSTSEGLGVKEYNCLNCGWTQSRQYKIPMVVVPPVIISGGGNNSGFGGGGFGGGGFGGGMTGGGGASGGW